MKERSARTVWYHMLKNGTRYQDLGANFFDRIREQKVVSRTVAHLQSLGYTVTLAKPGAAA